MVGSCYLQAFLENGHALVGVCDMQPSDALVAQTLAAGAQVHSRPGEWLQQADVVISAVFGSVALELLQACLPHLRKASVYVDMTTADPSDMRQAHAAAQECGVDFVDVAITGAVNLGQRKTPLLIAGEKAQLVCALYQPFGARLTVVGTRPGDAAALKLLRSIYTKGVEALAVECLVAAHRMDLTEELFNVLTDIDETPLRKLLESMVLTHIPHSARRRNEVMEAQHQMQQLALAPIVSPGVEQLFAATAQAQAEKNFTGKTPKEAVEWLASHVLASKSA